MTKVEITNFQSIKHAAFEFEGFTTIVGSNYIGKSALLRAINAALTNRSGVDFIRWGEVFCEVKINRPGLDLLWHKEEGHNFYIINNQRYDKIGRGEAPPILETLRYNPVKIGAEKLDLLYADQFNPLFMVDRRGSASTDLLTSIYKLDQIYKAKELCDKDIKTNKGLIGFKEKDLAFSEKDVQKIAPFPNIKESFSILSDKKKDLDQISADIDSLKSFIQGLIVSTERYRKLKQIEKVVIPSEDPLNTCKEDISKIQSYISRLDAQTAQTDKFKFISVLPEVSVDPVEKLHQEVKSVGDFLNRLSTSAFQVRKLSAINSITVNEAHTEIESSSKVIDILKEFNTKLPKLSASVKALSPIEQIELKESPDLDFNIITKLKLYQGTMKDRVDEILTLRTDLSLVSSDLSTVSTSLEEYPNCPACGSKVEHAHS